MTTRTDGSYLEALARLSVADLVDSICLVGGRLRARPNGSVDVGWPTERLDCPPRYVLAVAQRQYLVWDELTRRGGGVAPGEGGLG